MKNHLLSLLLIQYLLIPAFNQETRPVFISDNLDNYVARALTTEQIPGLAVCIVKDGQVVLMKGYGVKEWGVTDSIDRLLWLGEENGKK